MGEDPFYELFEQGRVGINDDESPWPWVELVADAGGTFTEFGNGNGYAVTEVSLEEGEYLVATVDRGFRIWTRDSVQPADIYGSGRTQHRSSLAMGSLLAFSRTALHHLFAGGAEHQ